jgi:hypothetical protein
MNPLRDGKWHDHDGGPCPVKGRDRVDAEGPEYRAVGFPAERTFWSAVIRFRVTKRAGPKPMPDLYADDIAPFGQLPKRAQKALRKAQDRGERVQMWDAGNWHTDNWSFDAPGQCYRLAPVPAAPPPVTDADRLIVAVEALKRLKCGCDFGSPVNRIAAEVLTKIGAMK